MLLRNRIGARSAYSEYKSKIKTNYKTSYILFVCRQRVRHFLNFVRAFDNAYGLVLSSRICYRYIVKIIYTHIKQ